MTPHDIAADLSALLDALRASPAAELRAEVRVAFDLAGLVYSTQPPERRPRPHQWREHWHRCAAAISRLLVEEERLALADAEIHAAHARERRWSYHVSVVGAVLDGARRVA